MPKDYGCSLPFGILKTINNLILITLSVFSVPMKSNIPPASTFKNILIQNTLNWGEGENASLQ